MDAELTNKSRDALNAATSRAVKDGHADLTPAHLLLALLAGEENENITDLLAATEADQAAVRNGAERLLAALPSVTGSTVAPRSPPASCSPYSPRPTSGPGSSATSTSPPNTSSSRSPPRAARPVRSFPRRARRRRSCWTPSRTHEEDGG